MGDPDVIPLWFGEPDRPTPDFIIEASDRALRAGHTFYSHNRGVPELRQALADYSTRLYDRPIGTDRITVTYASAFDLMRELRGMGETNALIERRRAPLRRATLFRMAEIYASRFPAEDGRIRATFQLVYLAGWAPHESQQKPLKPGSARQKLAEALGTKEQSAGEKAGPGN